MNAREAFKVNLLAACIDRGWDLDETSVALEKLAVQMERAKSAAGPWDVAAAPFQLAGSVVRAVGPTLATVGIGAGIGAPLLGGALAGSALAKARDDDSNIDEAKAEETIQAYEQLAADAKRRAQQRTLRQSAPPVRLFR